MAETRKPTKDQQRALTWAVQQGAPLSILVGWDPDTGKWSEESPIGAMLDRVSVGAHVGVAAKQNGIRRISELVQKGRDFLGDQDLPEDREWVPIEHRPFIDLVAEIDRVEATTEISAVEKLFEAATGADGDPRLVIPFLGRRFPARWREQQEIHSLLETDPREQAVNNLLADPNTAMQMAAFARQAAEAVTELEED